MKHSIQILIIPLLLFLITGCGITRQGGAAPLARESQAKADIAARREIAAAVLATQEAVGKAAQPETKAPVETDTSAPAGEPAGQAATGAAVATQNGLATGCPAVHFQSVQAHPANGAYPAPYLEVTCNGETFTVRSNGIPNFEFTQITPNDLAAQNYAWTIPLTPVPAGQPAGIPLLGPLAVAVNGIPIFGPNEAQPTWGDPYLDQILDYCNGHTAQQGMYHFHARPDCLFPILEGQAGLVVGYAFDGYPILAPYVCLDLGCTQVKEVRSSWQHTQNVPAAWEAHEYIEGSGDLDRCNGMTLADGSYAYFATDTFPYFLGCYHGLANASNGFGGPPPNNGGGPGGPPTGAGQTPPQGNGGGPGNLPGPGGRPDLAAAAARLGISEQSLREALGPPPPDFAAAAARLGLTEQALIEALSVPR